MLKKKVSIRKKGHPDRAGLAAGFLALCLCAAGFSSATWAYFTLNISSAESTIQASGFQLEAAVTSSLGEVMPDSQGIYTLAAGGEYEITLQAAGDASKGYARVFLNDTAMETVWIEQGSSLTFHVKSPDDDVLFRMESCWGNQQQSEWIANDSLISFARSQDDNLYSGNLQEEASADSEEQALADTGADQADSRISSEGGGLASRDAEMEETGSTPLNAAGQENDETEESAGGGSQ